MNKTAVMLHQKSFEFAVRVVKLARFLSDKKQDWVLARQILRSGTSIGANVRESRFAQSKADFISKLSIALKESSETQYWLELLYRTDYITEEMYCSMQQDCEELRKMLSSTTKTIKEN